MARIATSVPVDLSAPVNLSASVIERLVCPAGKEQAFLRDTMTPGLRRSFKSLTEWLDCPAGVVAQIMGHKPSATAEKHYTVRPLDLLRVYHERIEAWVLEQAGIAVLKTNELAVRRKVNDISNR